MGTAALKGAVVVSAVIDAMVGALMSKSVTEDTVRVGKGGEV